MEVREQLTVSSSQSKDYDLSCSVQLVDVVLFCHRLVGLVVKASASRAEGPGFESR